MSVMRVIVHHPHTKFEVREPPVSKICVVSVTALSSLMTLTFDLSISKGGHPCHGLPSCQILIPFLGATRSIEHISYGNVSVWLQWLGGWLSVTAGIVSKRLNLS